MNDNSLKELKIDEDMKLEEGFEQLEALISKMEERDLPLEESFDLYKKGLALVELCNRKIEKVECDIKRITE